MKYINVTAVGDIMVHQAQLDSAFDKVNGVYDFYNYFDIIKEYIKKDSKDLAICNFETTMGGGEYSGYPKFSSPEQLAADLKRTGFDLACASNNHTYDTGNKGIKETKRILEDVGIVVSGTRKSLNESAIGYIEKKGVKIAVINYTYQSASKDGQVTINGVVLDEESKHLINTYSEETLDEDLLKMHRDICDARNEGSDIVIFFLHWGNEYDTESQVHQKYIAHKLAKYGVDAVIGSHPHVCQEYEELRLETEHGTKIVPIFYSLGNFVSNMRGDIIGRETSNCGMIASIKFIVDENNFVTTKNSYIPTIVDVWRERGKTHYKILPLNDMEKYIVHGIRNAREKRERLDKIISSNYDDCNKEYRFEDIICIKRWEIFNLAEYLSMSRIESVHSDAGLIASIFVNGCVMGNSKGMAGITITGFVNGIIKKVMLMIKVNDDCYGNRPLPVCINRENLYKDDLWIPRDLVVLNKYDKKCPLFRVRKNVASSYLIMKAFALKDGIDFVAKSGYRAKRGQLDRRNEYIKENGPEKVDLRFDGHGYSEHLTGEAIDLYGVNVDNMELRKWLLSNAYKFGFVIRRLSENGVGTDFCHLRYVGDSILARYIATKNLSVEEFLMNYDKLEADLDTFDKQISNRYRKEGAEGLWKLSINKICSALNISVPYYLYEYRDMPIKGITRSFDGNISQEEILITSRNKYSSTEDYETAIKEVFNAGAITIITDVPVRNNLGKILPCIIVDDYKSAMSVLVKNRIINSFVEVTGVDPYNLWDGEKYNFTLEKISKISGISIPKDFIDKIDVPLKELSYNQFTTTDEEGLKVLFITVFNVANREKYIKHIEEGCVLVSGRYIRDDEGKILPAIYLPSSKAVRVAWRKIGEYIKSIFPMPTICITGSVGKTTTTELTQLVLAEKYNVFATGGNLNHPDEIVRQMILRYNSNYNMHVQETGGGSPGLVEGSALLFNPKMYCVTNVYPHHLNYYKNIEGVLHDKISFDRVCDTDTLGLINIDDEQLGLYSFNKDIIKVSLDSDTADVYAKNIKQNGEYLEFDAIYFDEQIPVRINIIGKHNVYNVLFALTFAKNLGLTTDEILNGLLKYKTKSIRQSIREINGRLCYIDCFNICKDSLFSSMDTLCELNVGKGNRRILVVNGENALGEQAYKVNYDIGKEFYKYDGIDEFICVGPKEPADDKQYDFYGHGRAVYEGALSTLGDKKVSFYDDLFKVAEKLRNETKPGDIILFKGVFRLPLFAAIDIAFGTSYLLYSTSFKKELIEENGYVGRYLKEIDSVNFMKGSVDKDTLYIPNHIKDKTIYRIGKNCFANSNDIKTIVFGDTVKTIGAGAFYGCKSIKTLVVPKNVIHLEENCFENCDGLEHVIFEGVEHIDRNAFKNCKKLKKVEFRGESYVTIAETAFSGCSNFKIVSQNPNIKDIR